MKPKQLKSLLDSLNGFENPKVSLEQYATSSELAVAITTYIDEIVGLENAFIADLGAGCGMLSTALAVYEPTSKIFAIELDADVIQICQQNYTEAEVEDRCHIIHGNALSSLLLPKMDIVLMNPPFGTKNNSGLHSGIKCLKPGGSLFSLHKSSTRDYILKYGNKIGEVKIECIAHLKWNLPATYKFHKRQSVDIEVDLMHFKKL